jgi:hypothetical protein
MIDAEASWAYSAFGSRHCSPWELEFFGDTGHRISHARVGLGLNPRRRLQGAFGLASIVGMD